MKWPFSEDAAVCDASAQHNTNEAFYEMGLRRATRLGLPDGRPRFSPVIAASLPRRLKFQARPTRKRRPIKSLMTMRLRQAFLALINYEPAQRMKEKSTTICRAAPTEQTHYRGLSDGHANAAPRIFADGPVRVAVAAATTISRRRQHRLNITGPCIAGEFAALERR